MKQLLGKGKILVTYLSVFSILAASILSVFTGVNIGVIAETGTPTYTVWDDKDANPGNVLYDDGEGTSVDPFIISTGDQLYRMVYEKGAPAGETAYYKLANDIYLNNIDNFDSWDDAGFDFSTLNNWASGLADKQFIGNFDGNGYTIYGMYAKEACAGFIPRIGEGTTTLKNVTIDKFYVQSTSGGFSGGAGAIIGRGTSNQNVKAVVSNCAVTNGTVKGSYAAAIFGCRYTSPLTLKHSLVANVNVDGSEYESGVFADGWSTMVSVSDCVFIGISPYGNKRNSVTTYGGTFVYTDTEAPDCTEPDQQAGYIKNHANNTANIVSTSELTGTAAGNLDLDWDNWQVNTNGYPTPKKEKVIGTGIGYVAANASDMWNGKASKNYAAGNGTANDPWIIETAEQFYLMVSTAGASEYYKIADGVEALYFNAVEGMNYEQAMAYLASSSALNYAPGEANAFSGYFDGNGATIYGISSIATGSTARVGVFPQVSKNATIKNITVKHSYFTMSAATEMGGAGGLVGSLVSGGSATIRNSAVIECKIAATGNTPAAGIIANTMYNSSNTTIKNCLVADCEITSVHPDSKYAAIVAGGWGSYKRVIEDCLTVGTYPTSGYNSSYPVGNNTYTDVYTTSSAPNSESATALAGYINSVVTDDIKGDAAKSALAGFDWDTQWTTGTNYPVPREYVAVAGTVGGVWSGSVADSFAGGSGTQNDPYQIDTAERLLYMLDHAAEGCYYALTQDIYLNDVTTDNWYESADVKSWVTSADVTAFSGRLDGGNHTVYGLYANNVPAGASAGLIPVMGSYGWVRNVVIDKAYIAGAAGSNIGAVAGSAESNAAKTMSIRGCEVKENVILNGGGNVGGIIGYVGVSAIRIDNVAFKGQITGTCAVKGGINATSDGATTVKASFSVGVAALGDADGYSITDIYSDVAGVNSNETVLTAEQMKGENAKTYMSALAWDDGAWATNADDYPTLVDTVKPSDGVAGEVWSGEKATGYAGGDGTANNPYQIATGEQLYKLYKDDSNKVGKYYIITADILLNDVNSDFWTSQIGLNSWGGSSIGLKGHVNGNGHVIVGLYINTGEETATGGYPALFSAMYNDASIEKLGLSYAYIAQSTETSGNYFTAGFVGLVANWDGESVITDELIDGEYNGMQVPRISECFVDHNSYLAGYHVGGIVCGNNGGIIVENCYFTGAINTGAPTSSGCIIGDGWSSGCIVTNCFAASQTADRFCAGSKFTGATEGAHDIVTTGNYAFTIYSYYGYNKLKFVADCYGQANYDIMARSEENPDGMDFENIWMMVEDGTPVLRAFNHTSPDATHADTDNIRTAEAYSCKNLQTPKTTVTLQTGTSAIAYEPIVQGTYETLELPTPSREGYKFTGWYVYSDYQCLYDYGYQPPRNLTLYAGWEQYALIQDFEDYTNTYWDIDYDHWVTNKPGARGGYKVEYTHGGSKSMHRLATEGEQDCLLNYADTLTVGQTYTMTFWVTTDTPNTTATLSLVHNNWPDYLDTAVSVENMVTATGLTVGKWTQYTYSFTAKTQWISLRTTGNASLYFDDFIISPTGTLVENNNVVNLGTGSTTATNSTNSSSTAPNTGESAAPIVALVATIIACAIVMLVSRKGCVEIIEK